MGLGTTPDFTPKACIRAKRFVSFFPQSRPISDAAPSEDPDAALVERVQNGDIDVFEELVRRHSRRVFGVLAGIVGNMDDVRDATQGCVLEGVSSTSIASGTIQVFRLGSSVSPSTRELSFSDSVSPRSPWRKSTRGKGFVRGKFRAGQTTLSSSTAGSQRCEPGQGGGTATPRRNTVLPCSCVISTSFRRKKRRSPWD